MPFNCFKGNKHSKKPPHGQAQGMDQPRGGKREKRVAICSRDSEENSQWLQGVLKNSKYVKDSHHVYISNNSSEFRSEVLQYDVAILYHTKRRGRVNLTNVTDSLYDEELKFLHRHFGAKNIIVVIDDLERSDEDEKRKILSAQVDLENLTKEVLLFTEQDKRQITAQRIEEIQVEEKLKTLLKTIDQAKKRSKKKNPH